MNDCTHDQPQLIKALVIIFLQKTRTKYCLNLCSPDITGQDVPLNKITHSPKIQPANKTQHIYLIMRILSRFILLVCSTLWLILPFNTVYHYSNKVLPIVSVALFIHMVNGSSFEIWSWWHCVWVRCFCPHKNCLAVRCVFVCFMKWGSDRRLVCFLCAV